MPKPWVARLAVLAIVIVAVGLRAWGINDRLLWQDEAESAIYALQILDVGYPNAEFRGERLYENRSFIPDSHPRYEFQSTNYVGSRFEKNKGWLPYYLIAGSFKIFGTGTWQARLPSLAAAVGTIFVLWALGRRLLPRGWLWLPAVLHALNPVAMYYERQARYYSLVILLVSLSLLSYVVFRRRPTRCNLLALTVMLVALFHTHIVAAAVVGMVLVVHWLGTERWPRIAAQRGLGLAVGLSLAATVPWLALVNFPAVWRYQGLESYLRYVFLGVIATAAVSGWLLVRGLRRWLQLSISFGWVRAEANVLLVFFCVVYFIAMPLLAPAESVAERQFLPLLPALYLLTAYLLSLLPSRTRRREACAGLLLVVGLAGGLFVPLHLDTRARASLYEVAWVPPLVERLRREGGLEGKLVLTDYFQFPLSFYGGTPVQLLYMLRCEYLQAYPDGILYLVHPIRPPQPPGTPPAEALPYCYTREQVACGERLTTLRACLQFNRTCQFEDLNGTLVVSCSPPRVHG